MSSAELMTTDEFPTWAEDEEGRWELHDGVAIRITPERADHVRTKGEAAVAMRLASRHAGCDCEVFGSGLGVQIDQRTVYAPDGAIVWGPKLPDDAILLVNLIVVVEGLSPSTAAIDHGRKLSGYFSLPSVEHYLILDPDRRVVIHHKRGLGEAIETRVLSAGAVKLEPPGFEVAVEALFLLDRRPTSGGSSDAKIRT
ncbi:MAG TPA: Uma2 family endonuclease [Roseiarcus sp.]|jgi:Uma2 family endonuclease